MNATEYTQVNRANWDERAPAHAQSPDYAVAELVSGSRRISDVVAFDEPRLGDVTGLRGIHLQCHIGTDTLSLQRLGARMTGLDFSGESLRQARDICARAGADIGFVQSDVYDAVAALEAAGEPTQYDLVFTGIGALCWLPSVERWAQVVGRLLTPGGRLFIREGHPMLWSLADTRTDDLLVVDYPYFEQAEPTVWDQGGTYVETDTEFTTKTTYDWNHGLAEIITALMNAGLRLTALEEHDSVPWPAFEGGLMEPHPDHPGEQRLAERPSRVAMSYTLQAVRE